MAFNSAGKGAEIGLDVFGGIVTEMSATDVPPGVSPDNAEMSFVPGSVFTRAGFRKVLPSPIVGNPAVTYGKSYQDPTGAIRNLYFDAQGALWVEDLSSPGVLTLLLQSTPDCYAKSVTAFGREYIAISDGLHGQEVPLQYDGTNLDRVTQDGPGAPPTVVSLALPSVLMAVTGAPSTLTISECDPASADESGEFHAINVFTTAGLGALEVGSVVTISGSVSPYNGTWSVIAAYDNAGGSLFVVAAYLPAGTVYHSGGTVTIGSGTTARRSTNIVTIKTAAVHNLQVGYQVQITGLPAATVGTVISTVVINNEDLPGLATVTTSAVHGLVPGLYVSLIGIVGSAVGGAIVSATRHGNVVTVVTTTAHGLSPGSEITVAGVTDTSFNTSTTVLQVVSTTVYTYYQVAVDAASSSGTTTILWPIPNTETPTYYEVMAAPTTTTFQVQIAYSDGSWTGGLVKYAWDGKFFVSAVLSTTEFQYQQYGPNATSATVGTVTPYGQVAPGEHQMQVLFLTRQGYVTRPSPPVKFIANGGQYLSVSNIPIGPPNVVSRILAFTGARGGYFFYIPVPAQEMGQVVSTSTQIDDNTTTGAVLDFSDNTLYAALSISTPGNQLANQIVLDSALGFGFYGSRLLTYGQRNIIQNLLNMGFDGGYMLTAPTVPSGWNAPGSGGTLATGHFGGGWQISITPSAPVGQLTQSFYLDAYGAPIGTSKVTYTARVWAKLAQTAADVRLTIAITSTSTSFASYAVFSGSDMSTDGGWLEQPFSVAMPNPIPPDMKLTIYASATASTVVLLVDELSIIYAESPYLDTVAFVSYVNNPEGFDGLSGKFGAVDDTRKLMDWGIVRNALYLLTRDPSGRLHRTSDNGVTEPAGWSVDEIGANCGALSAFCLTHSQADDASAGGGEEWFAWASASGARLFGGDQPWKISQEIQPDWDLINFPEAKTAWALNDPVARVIYFGVPRVTATTPNVILPVTYRQLDTPYQIAMANPVRVSNNGKLAAPDNARKWTRWNRPMLGASMMYRSPGELSVVLFGSGNVYTLDTALLTDDDYGKIVDYYTTAFFPDHEQEQSFQLGLWRKVLLYTMAQLSGVGQARVGVLCNSLANRWPLDVVRVLDPDAFHDFEWGGGNAQGQRMALKIEGLPTTGTDHRFMLQKVGLRMRPAKLAVRGAL